MLRINKVLPLFIVVLFGILWSASDASAACQPDIFFQSLDGTQTGELPSVQLYEGDKYGIGVKFSSECPKDAPYTVSYTQGKGSDTAITYDGSKTVGSKTDYGFEFSVGDYQFRVDVGTPSNGWLDFTRVVHVIPKGGSASDANGAASNDPKAQPTQFDFKIENPIGVDTLEDLVKLVGTYIFNISIPIAVIIIIYGGIMMLLGGYDPKYFSTGKTALTNALIGLAVIFIGQGFVSLIQSILSLKDTTP